MKEKLMSKDRVNGSLTDFRLWEEEIEGIVKLNENRKCEHMPTESGKFQVSFMKTKEDLTVTVLMCVSCYQKLRDAGVAYIGGTWE